MTPIVDPTRLLMLADTLEIRGDTEPFVKGLRDAAAEIETLRYTVKASVELANRAAEQSVRDREQMEQVRNRASSLHHALGFTVGTLFWFRSALKSGFKTSDAMQKIDEAVKVVDEARNAAGT